MEQLSARTCRHHSRFFTSTDVNQWLFRHWQFCTGNFALINPYRDRKCFDLHDTNAVKIAAAIKNSEYKEIVINDSAAIKDFENTMRILKDASV